MTSSFRLKGAWNYNIAAACLMLVVLKSIRSTSHQSTPIVQAIHVHTQMKNCIVDLVWLILIEAQSHGNN